jgi:hypothetical protein
MKITEQNRSLVFLAGTLIMGILIICVLLFVESNDVEGVKIVNEQANTNFKALETKIENLKKQNFDPNSYNTIVSGINSSFEQDLITGSAKSNLVSKLTTVYSDLVYKQCDFFLSNNIGNSQEVSSWLNQLEKITSGNSKIDTYKSQIKWYNYYATTLPKKVNAFIRPGITNYDEDKYKKYKQEVQNMPNFEPSYKNRPKFNKIRNNLKSELENFNADFYTAGTNK